VIERARLAALVAALAIAAGGCAGTPRTTFPPTGSTPQPAGDATAATIRDVVGALAAAGLPASESLRAYRPPEGPLLAAAPRTVLQATLPDDPSHGFVVIYALPTEALADAAARDMAAYIASNPGRVQFTPDAHFVLRVVRSTVVFFWWSPGASTDQRTHLIEEALATLGTAVQVAA
jgi:hypothetical protein